MKPNYSKYSEEQLLDVQRHVDRHRFPERAKEIDEHLSNPEMLAQAQYIQAQVDYQRRQERQRRKLIFVNLLPIFIGLMIGSAGFNSTYAESSIMVYKQVSVYYLVAIGFIIVGALRLYHVIRKSCLH